MSTFDKLLAAEFRGIPFLVDTEDTSEGRKIAVHEYVNNNKRFVEDLGELPSTFTVAAFVHGDNAIQQSNNLRAALRDATQGSVTLPHFGTFEVKPGPFTASTKMTSVGRVDFKLTFYLSSPGIFPVSQDNTPASLGVEADATREGIGDNLGNNLNVPDSAATQLLTEGKILEAATLWDDIVAAASGPLDLIASASQIVGEIRSTISTLVRFPELLAARVTDLYNNFAALELQLDSLLDGLGFGDGDSEIDESTGEELTAGIQPTTPDRIERIENVVLINDFIKVNTIITLLEQSSATEFETEDQLNTVLERLEDAYSDVRESDILLIEPPEEEITVSAGGVVVSGGIVVDGIVISEDFTDSSIVTEESTSVIDNFNAVRNIGIRLLEDKEQATSRVTEISIFDTSVSLLTYQLYGNLDRIDSIARLNPEESLANLSGTAKVLSDDAN